MGHREAASKLTGEIDNGGMNSRGARNSAAAQDWALKRKQQMERAERLRAERQATLGRGRGAADEVESAEGSAPDSAGSPPTATGAAPRQHYDNGQQMMRSCSQPTSDMPGGMQLPVRGSTSNSERPEWARDFVQPRPRHDADDASYEKGGAQNGPGPTNWDWYQDSQQSNAQQQQQQQAAAAYYYQQQQQAYYYQQQQAYYYQQQQQYMQQQPSGQPPPPPPNGFAPNYAAYPPYAPAGQPPSHFMPPPGPGAEHAAAAATAARWAAVDVPLHQSDGGIGFNRARQQPRVGLQDVQPPPSGREERAGNGKVDANDFFGNAAPHPARPLFPPPAPAAASPPRRRAAHTRKRFPAHRTGLPSAAPSRRAAAPSDDASKFFGFDEPQQQPTRTGAIAGRRLAARSNTPTPETEFVEPPAEAPEEPPRRVGAVSAGRRRQVTASDPPQRAEWNADFSVGPSPLDEPPPQVASRRPTRVASSADRVRQSGDEMSGGAGGATAGRGGQVNGARNAGGRAALAAANGRAARERPRPEWNNDFTSVPGPLTAADDEAPPPDWFNEMRGEPEAPPAATGGRRDSKPVSQQRRPMQQQQPPPQQPPPQQQQQYSQRQPQYQPPPQPTAPELPTDGPRAPKNVERPLPRPGQNYEAEAEAAAAAASRSDDLVPCDLCGRCFAPDRIQAHMRVCQKASAKPRRVFNAAKQRWGEYASDGTVDLKTAGKELQQKARVQAEYKKGPSDAPPPAQSSGSGARDPERRAGPAPSNGGRDPERRAGPAVMLGKDGRPLSPLSSAIARAKAGFDPEEGDDAPQSELAPCPCCGRNFMKERLATHVAICQKVQVNQTSRRTWNASEQRVDKDRIPQSLASPAPMPASRGRFNNTTGMAASDRRPPSMAARSSSGDRPGSRAMRSSTPASGGGGGGEGSGRASTASSANGMPANKIPKWKRDQMAFENAIKEGRKVKYAQDHGLALPPPVSLPDEADDRVQCPHCNRKFNALAAERHIPKCVSIMAKPKSLARGAGTAGGANATGGMGRGFGGTGRGFGGGGGRDYVL